MGRAQKLYSKRRDDEGRDGEADERILCRFNCSAQMAEGACGFCGSVSKFVKTRIVKRALKFFAVCLVVCGCKRQKGDGQPGATEEGWPERPRYIHTQESGCSAWPVVRELSMNHMGRGPGAHTHRRRLRAVPWKLPWILGAWLDCPKGCDLRMAKLWAQGQSREIV